MEASVCHLYRKWVLRNLVHTDCRSTLGCGSSFSRSLTRLRLLVWEHHWDAFGTGRKGVNTIILLYRCDL